MTKALTHPLDVGLGCRCGRVRGVASHVSPSTGFRFVCYCNDCQAFARFLDRRDVLNAAGGTDIFQMPPGRVRLSAGTDALRCLQLSNKVLRWCSDCCQTPIANTAASPRVPMIGVIHCCMDHEGDNRSRDEVLGPPLCRIYESSAVGPLPPSAPSPSLGSFRPPCVNAARLVGARARPADTVLRRWHEGAARGAPRAQTERARRGFARPVTAVVSRSQVAHRTGTCQSNSRAIGNLRSGGSSYAPRCRVSTGQGRITLTAVNVRIERESITLPLYKGCRAARPPLPNVVRARNRTPGWQSASSGSLEELAEERRRCIQRTSWPADRKPWP